MNDPYVYDEDDEDEENPEKTARTITMWKLTEDDLEKEREFVRLQQREDQLTKQIEELAGNLIRERSRVNREKNNIRPSS